MSQFIPPVQLQEWTGSNCECGDQRRSPADTARWSVVCGVFHQSGSQNQTSSPARSPFLFSFLFSPRLPVKVNEATRQRQAETLVSRHVSSSQSSIHNQPTQDTRLKKITDTFTQSRGVRIQHRSRS